MLFFQVCLLPAVLYMLFPDIFTAVMVGFLHLLRDWFIVIRNLLFVVCLIPPMSVLGLIAALAPRGSRLV